MPRIYTVPYLIVGYLFGVLLSEHVFSDFALTHWGNIWVYVWLLWWPACLVYLFSLYALAAVVFLVTALWVLGYLIGVRRVWLKRKSPKATLTRKRGAR